MCQENLGLLFQKLLILSLDQKPRDQEISISVISPRIVAGGKFGVVVSKVAHSILHEQTRG